MVTLPIICAEGIGDSLLVLGRVPVRLLTLLGIKFRVYYESKNESHPARHILPSLFEGVKNLEFIEGEPSEREKMIFSKIMSISQRSHTIYPFPLKAENDIRLKKRSDKHPQILIQTHLDGHHGWKGATAKIWKIENWISVIQELHRQGIEISILEWDEASREKMIQECPFVLDKGSKNLRELCLEMSEYDCVVSVDSWVKYAASWSNTPQVIIVPDLRNGYEQSFQSISPKRIATWWFHGLLGRPDIRVIGLEKINNEYKFTLESINYLGPDFLIGEIQKLSKINC